MSPKRSVEFLIQIADYMSKSKSFDRILKEVKITDGSAGRCVAKVVVTKEQLNEGGTLHGGFIATVIDNVTTYALMSKSRHPGVSVDLHVSYLKPIKNGDELIVDANTIRAGNKLAYIECELRLKKCGTLVAKGRQTKYIDFE